MGSVDIMQVKTLARFRNKELLKGKKADFHVCSIRENIEGSIKTNCEECGKKCYYIDEYEDIKDMIKKKHKKICIPCALKNKDLDPEAKKLFEMVIRKEREGYFNILL